MNCRSASQHTHEARVAEGAELVAVAVSTAGVDFDSGVEGMAVGPPESTPPTSTSISHGSLGLAALDSLALLAAARDEADVDDVGSLVPSGTCAVGPPLRRMPSHVLKHRGHRQPQPSSSIVTPCGYTSVTRCACWIHHKKASGIGSPRRHGWPKPPADSAPPGQSGWQHGFCQQHGFAQSLCPRTLQW